MGEKISVGTIFAVLFAFFFFGFLAVGCGEWCLGVGDGAQCSSPASPAGSAVDGGAPGGALNRGGVYTPGGEWSPALDNARAACERAVLNRCEFLEWDRAVNGGEGARQVSGEVSVMCRAAVLDAVATCLSNQAWYQERFGKSGYTVTHVRVRCKSYMTGRDLTEFRLYCPAAMGDYGGQMKFCDPLSPSGADACPQIHETTLP